MVVPVIENEKLERRYKASEAIQSLLDQNQIWATCEPCDFGVRVSIEGDWKHDHLRARYLLIDAGYDYRGEVPTEDTGEDYYPADHYILVM